MFYQNYFSRKFLACVTLLITMRSRQSVYGYSDFKAHVVECTQSNLQNTTCLPVNRMFETVVYSAIQCSLLCTPYVDCMGFYYHPGNKRCTGCDNIYSGNIYKPPQLYHGVRYYHATLQQPKWKYLGCFYDGRWPNGVFPDPALTHYSLTRKICFNHCLSKQANNVSSMYFAMQNGNQCYCGGVDVNYKAYGTVSYGGCYTACAGNSRQACGGYYINSVYMIIPVA